MKTMISSSKDNSGSTQKRRRRRMVAKGGLTTPETGQRFTTSCNNTNAPSRIDQWLRFMTQQRMIICNFRLGSMITCDEAS
mmetsp:Transcript_18190/g.36694  ORF Transcript_18190/g.36694 Transcript_18190/m.36694 type:complete len:81 (-) Transcript_18190:191-433(-)